MSNLKKIKQDKKHAFKYGTLLIFLALYFLNEIPSVKGKVQWAYDRLVAMQIKEGLWGIRDATMRISSLWGYFKTFQAAIKKKERIPKEIVEKYEKTIFFMVDKDQCQMEVVEPRKIWIMPMAYEVDSIMLEAYSQHLLSQLVDPKEERFGTIKEKELELHKQFTTPARKIKVTKMAEEVIVQMGFT